MLIRPSQGLVDAVGGEQPSESPGLTGDVTRPGHRIQQFSKSREVATPQSPIRLAGTLTGLATSRAIGREVAQVLAVLAPALASGICVALHVTAPNAGVGVSTVARELAATACYLPIRRPLLLGTKTGRPAFELPIGTELPDLIASYRSQAVIEVMEVRAAYGLFHAANFITGFGEQSASLDHASSRPLRGLWADLQGAYDLIVLDCPPVPSLTGFLPIAHGEPQVLLVVAAGATRASEAVRARVQVERMGGRLVGAVMNRSRNLVSRS